MDDEEEMRALRESKLYAGRTLPSSAPAPMVRSLRDMVPKAFGAPPKKPFVISSRSVSQDQVKTSPLPMVGPQRPPQKQEAPQEEEESEEEDDESEEEEEEEYPWSEIVEMKAHSKAIGVLAMDPKSSKLVSGGLDSLLAFWEFHGMNSSMKPKFSCKPEHNHEINHVSFNPTGGRLVITTGASKARLFSNQGHYIAETRKGDMYVMDPVHTMGHTHQLTCSGWHPDPIKGKTTFLTSSIDSTIRVWHVEEEIEKHVHVMKHRDAFGKRTGVSTFAFSKDAQYIVAGCMDGSLQCWNYGRFMRPTKVTRKAHGPNGITSVAFSEDHQTIATRGMDGTLKLWDLRKFNQPIGVLKGLSTTHLGTNCQFSPDERHIVTCTAVDRAVGEPGYVVMVDRYSPSNVLEIAEKKSPCAGSVNCVLWDGNVNQIFAGGADGTIYAMYSPSTSKHGVLWAVNKAVKKKMDDIVVSVDLNSIAVDDEYRRPLPEYKEYARTRYDPVATKMPQPPLERKGMGGQIGTSLNKHIVQSMVPERYEDTLSIRERLLAAGEEIEKKGLDGEQGVAGAYKETQPQPIFDYEALELEAKLERHKRERGDDVDPRKRSRFTYATG